ncbi:MAG: helix-turn-helix domain-containing protein [Candidatus Aenigmarchaeota archaeon]|nr:helix-turn-helix domain-containing protein [Candidatus Aenigmarchaeota archaeon]
MIRKGKDFYHNQYDKAMQMYRDGISIKDIANSLGISYSSVYSWTKGKIPEEGKLNEFIAFLEKTGPSPVIVIREMFSSHDDLYQNSLKRGFNVKRYKTSLQKIGSAATWYYLEGQEDELKKRVLDMVKRYKELREKFVA